MKTRFILLTLLLLFARGCDFYSTSLWFFQENGMAGERNPLTYFFGVGWNGLLISNAMIIGVIIGLLYYFYFRYQPKHHFKQNPQNYWEFASLLYFDAPNQLHQLLYKLPKNKAAFYAHTGYVMTVVVIFASFLATFHNCAQFYQWAFYQQFRVFVGRPLFVIYGLMVLAFVITYRQLLMKEYQKFQRNV